MTNRDEYGAMGSRFQDLNGLIQYYSGYLPEPQIEMTILEAGMNFISRTFGSPEQERLQFLKRCESGMKAECRRMRVEINDFILPECATVSP